MKRAPVWAAGLLALAAACPTAAAQPPSIGPFGAGSAQRLDAGSAPASDNMQENVEILRRLLDKALSEAYGLPARRSAPTPRFYPLLGATDEFQYKDVSGSPAPDSHAGVGPHTEGVYLKDYGVVYTAALPLPPFSVVAGSGAAPAGKQAPDDWDLVRKEIHGETPDPGAKAVPGHTPLSEVILKVLADNGRHFSGLQDGEKITVAVTFRGAATCANCHQSPGPNWPPATYHFQNSQQSPAGQPGAAGPPGGADAAAHPGTPQDVADARNDILLGDLHMKQGKTQDAIDAYNKAAKQIQPNLQYHETWEPGLQRGDVPALLTAVDIGNKLAAAYVQAGNDQAASKTLKETAAYAKQAERLTGVAVPVGAGAQPAAQALPSKLVVTATKKQVDDTASGKLTFEAFCKAAAVEFVSPPAEKK